MEKLKGSNSPIKKMKTNFNLCLPRLHRFNTTAAATKPTKPLTPMTLLERFRQAVFRLIMLSALSKAGNVYSHPTRSSTASSFHSSSISHVSRSCYDAADPHHSEAVADCIEFIKKKASPEDGIECSDHHSRDSTASTSSNVDAVAAHDDHDQMVTPVTVM